MSDYFARIYAGPSVSFPESWDEGMLRNEYGIIRFRESGPDTVYLYDFHVDADVRRQGHGRRIMETVIREVTARGFDLTLIVDSKNTSAIRLYESLGFVMTEPSFMRLYRPESMQPYPGEAVMRRQCALVSA